MSDNQNTEQVVETTATPVTEVASSAPSWNGELESLEKESWYTAAPEEVRKGFRTGYETKLKNYDKGWQEKVRTLKSVPDDWSAKEQEWKTKFSEQERRAALYESLFAGQEDPRVATAATEKATWEAEKAALIAERDTYKGQAMAVQEAKVTAHADKITTTYADVLENEAAAKMFWTICQADGRDDVDVVTAQAAKAVRAAYDLTPKAATPAPAADEAEPLPDDLDLASPGDSAHGTNASSGGDDDDVPWEVAVQRSIAKHSRRIGA